MNNSDNPEKSNKSKNNPPQTNTFPITTNNRVNKSNQKIKVAKSSKASQKESVKEYESKPPKAIKIHWLKNSKGWGNFFNFCIFLITAITCYMVKTHFDITNKPTLQFSSFKIDSFVVNKPAVVSYELSNIGAYPIEIIESRTLVKIKDIPPDFIYSINQYNTMPLDKPNTIVSKEYPLKRTQFCDIILDSSKVELASMNGWKVYFIGFFRYKNLSNNKICEYQFEIETTPYFGKNEFNFIINQNIDLN